MGRKKDRLALARGADTVKAKRPDRQTYERELERLQGELVKLQFWVKESGAKIVVVFEGRDAAGKGGVIKRIMERVSPRVFRVVALPAPTEAHAWLILSIGVKSLAPPHG